MQTQTLATIWLGLLLVGCQRTDSQNSRITAQSANLVCAGYGVSGAAFNDCVSYQDSRNPGFSVSPYRMDGHNNRIDAEGYAVDSMGRRMPVQNYFEGRTSSSQPSSRQPVLRDEYGNRYDARGNRM